VLFDPPCWGTSQRGTPSGGEGGERLSHIKYERGAMRGTGFLFSFSGVGKKTVFRSFSGRKDKQKVFELIKEKRRFTLETRKDRADWKASPFKGETALLPGAPSGSPS